MVVAGDNLDLAVRRKRLGLTQQQVADELGITSGTAISRFETLDMPLPHGKTRANYVKFLDKAEREAEKSSERKSRRAS